MECDPSPFISELDYNIDSNLDKVVKSFDHIVSDLKQLFFDGRIVEAKRAIDSMESLLSREGRPEQLDILQNHLQTFKTTELYETIQADYKLICKTFEEFEHSDWTKVNQTGNSVSSYQLQNGIHKIKIESTIKAELFSILAVLSEPDLYTMWFPHVFNLGLKQAVEVEQSNRLNKIAYFVFSLPWPMTDRDMAVRAVTADLFEDGKVLIALENMYSHPKVPKTDLVHVDCLSGGLLVKPTGEDEVYFSMMYNIDPHLSKVPDWLVNWIMSFFASYVCDYLCKLAVNVGKQPDCPYQKLIDEKNQFYSHVKQRVLTYKKHIAEQ